MADTFQFQCSNCGKITERPRNPRTCPSCGETVMRPVELSEPDSGDNSLQTEDFDVDSAISDLNDMKSSPSEDTTGTTPDSTENNDPQQSSDSSETGGIISKIRSLF